MQLEVIILSEVSQEKKDNYHMISLICKIQNITQRNLSMTHRQSHGHRRLVVAMEERVGGGME